MAGARLSRGRALSLLVWVVLDPCRFACPVAAEYHADAALAGSAARGCRQARIYQTTRHNRGGCRPGDQPGPQGAEQYGEWRGRGIPAAMAAQDRRRDRAG
ncbi:hypothetical protein CNECB9_2370050 [Cupriavidus necator]|uniref:Uncharacterized protein n=1 Tax=Cupriavidus necator TaxID=106590 RepID=A0A1K0IE72_CUPNE|nr:hypothetical protein CNECB9_2370050 [Cupriavidus necator]